MSATEVLRRMLDERGVEWDADDETLDDGSLSQVTYWYSNEIEWSADGRDEFLAFDAVQLITPEQAIAATLGSSNCSNNCANSERTNATRLPHFWTHDGTLHIEATRMPTRIVVCEGGTCEFVPKRGLDASEAENAKLREQGARLFDKTLELGTENASLRELARDMHAAICELCALQDCDACNLRDEGACERGVLTARACELRVEVTT